MAVLSAAIFLGRAPLAVIMPAAVVVAGLGAASSPAIGAALRLIVSDSELPAAISVSQARSAVVALVGPTLGGLLFEISPSLPFVADALSYGVSLLGVLALRTQLAAPESAAKGGPLLKDVAGGLKFIYHHRLMRFTMASAAVLNFVFSGVLLSVLITVVRDGSGDLTAGTVIGFVGLGSLIGSLLAPMAKNRLSLGQVMVIITWLCTAAVAAMAFTRDLYLLGALVALSALLIPALNVVVASTQTLLTPDRLLGRTQSASSFIALLLSPLGAVVAGVLLTSWRPVVAFLMFAGLLLMLAVASTRSRSLRQDAEHASSTLPSKS
jgi:MFS family permease